METGGKGRKSQTGKVRRKEIGGSRKEKRDVQNTGHHTKLLHMTITSHVPPTQSNDYSGQF